MNDDSQIEAMLALWESKHEKNTVGERNIVEEMALQANEGFKRCRSALLVLLLASLALLVGFFDQRGSWLYTQDFQSGENIKYKEPIDPIQYADKQDALIDAINRESENNKPEYKRHLLHEIWDGNFKTVDVPALGIEFYVEDLPLVGAFAIFLILSWLYIYFRRSKGISHAIYEKVREAEAEKNRYIVEYLYNSLALNQIFITVKGIDDNEDLKEEKIVGRGIKIIWIIFFVMLSLCILGLVYSRNAYSYIAVILLFFILLFSCTISGRTFLLISERMDNFMKVVLNKTQNNYARLFARFGLLFPIFVLTIVLSHDIYETYFWRSRGQYLPNIYLITAASGYALDTSLLPPLPKDERNLRYDEYTRLLQFYNVKYVGPLDRQLKNDLVQCNSALVDLGSRGDSINNQTVLWKKERTLEIIDSYKHSFAKLQRTYFKPATLFEDIKARTLYYTRMNTKMFRIFGFLPTSWPSILIEVIILRTAIPIFMLLVCFLISIRIIYINYLTGLYFNEINDIKNRMDAAVRQKQEGPKPKWSLWVFLRNLIWRPLFGR